MMTELDFSEGATVRSPRSAMRGRRAGRRSRRKRPPGSGAAPTRMRLREEHERLYSDMLERITDNRLDPKAGASVVPWDRIRRHVTDLSFLIVAAFSDRVRCHYDTRRPMGRANS